MSGSYLLIIRCRTTRDARAGHLAALAAQYFVDPPRSRDPKWRAFVAVMIPSRPLLSRWTSVDIPHPGGDATGHHMAAMAHDPVHHNIVLFGGYIQAWGDAPVDEIWTYDGSAWTQHAPPDRPSPRAGPPWSPSVHRSW